MVKSHISKTTENRSFDILKTITTNELEHRTFTFRKLPLCLKIDNNKYIIGRYKLLNTTLGWQVTSDQVDLVFGDLNNAMYYCICMLTNNEENAKILASLDARLQFLTSDIGRYKTRIVNAHKAKDGWKLDLYAARYKETKATIEAVANELLKIVKLTKYYELRDFNHETNRHRNKSALQ